MSTNLIFTHFFLIMSIMLAMMNSSWFGLWALLEINMIMFITIMKLMETPLSKEAMLKYFLIQSMSSYVLITSTIFLKEWTLMAVYWSVLALVMKLGGSPFHFWLPQVSEGLNWNPILILMTLQKIIPLMLINHLTNPSMMKLIITLSILSSVSGALGGLNETSTRKMISFSSINHMGWMLISMPFNQMTWIIYLLIYSTILTPLIWAFNKSLIFYINQTSTKLSTFKNTSIMISLLSLGGLPPLLGFFPKLIILLQTFSFTMIPFILIILMSNILTLYFYMRINNLNFLTKIMNQPTNQNPITPQKHLPSSANIMMNLTGLFFCVPLWSLLK